MADASTKNTKTEEVSEQQFEQDYFFPTHGVTVKATSMADALTKLEALKK